MKFHATWMGALALALLVAGCGQATDSDATLNITSVPQAEVFVDGVSQGTSGKAIVLAPGEHTIEVKRDRFLTHTETVTVAAGGTLEREVTLAAQDPSDPVVIAALAASEGVDVAPFVAPETHRGSRDKRSVAVLLWPSRDVRKTGLVNYAIEADETYEGDASLEFRHGRKVLFRQAFRPESVTTVRPIPAEVLEHVKTGRKITWGLYFEDSRRPVKTSFKVVQRPKAQRQLDRLATSRHMQRQPQITREIMAATVLENNRLYTEALVANLEIASNHPNSTQPYRGIVTTLRRLDAEHSELFAFVSPHVSGKGGRSGVNTRPTASTTGVDLGIGAWSPVQRGALPTAVADATPGTAKGMGPGGAGVTPQGGASDTPATPSEPGVAAPESAADQAARVRAARLESMQAAATELQSELDETGQRADEASATAFLAQKNAEEADAKAKAAEAEAAKAREVVENADSPTREQQEAMYRAGMAAEEAREAANAANQAAEEARSAAEALEQRRSELTQELDAMNQALKAAAGEVPGAQTPERTRMTLDQAEQAVATAETALGEANARVETTQAAVQAAEQRFAADPSATNRSDLENATRAFEDAKKLVAEQMQALEAAKSRLEAIGDQVQESDSK